MMIEQTLKIGRPTSQANFDSPWCCFQEKKQTTQKHPGCWKTAIEMNISEGFQWQSFEAIVWYTQSINGHATGTD